MTKWERRKAREAQRKAEADERRNEKIKKSDRKPTKNHWRKLKDGGIAYGDKFKIGRGGLIGITFVSTLIILLTLGFLGYYDEFLEGFVQEAHAVPANHITIGIYHSESCKRDIMLGGDCMTYRDLAVMIDNTNQAISGFFVEDEELNDVRRLPPSFVNHVNYYQYSGMKYIIAVDPDTKWYNTRANIRIAIEPSDFIWLDEGDFHIDMTNTDEKVPDDLIQRHNVYVDGCSFARVKGEPELVLKVIDYFMHECKNTAWSPDDAIQYVPHLPLPINYDEHGWYKYNAWLNKAISACRIKC